MKKIILTAAIVLPLAVQAQQGPFTITGNIGKLNSPAMAYIDYMSNGVSKEDSAVVINGKFSFSGKCEDYAHARLALSHDGSGKMKAVYTGDVIYFYYGKEQVKITSADSLSNAKITGSKTYNEFQAYNKFIGGTIMDLNKWANGQVAGATPEQRKDTNFMNNLNIEYRRRMKARADKQLDFAKANPKAYFGMVALSEGTGSPVDVKKVEPIYNAMSAALRNSDQGREMGQRITAAKTIRVGAPAPKFVQKDVNDKTVQLDDVKGKYVLLEFWASWCGPCRAENPNLTGQYKKYKEKGFEIIAVSLDDHKDKWIEAIAKDGLPWMHVSDLKGWNNEVGRLYGIRAVPANFLLDENRNIIAVNLRGEELNKKLTEVFGN
ncbi:TlpA disulfide reductase family protein [Chitinophaga sp. sic0106]|uniref:TlpA disulfide reductase family protein n=1 Tax=Chitinophaga sp. sic0106 TaxID=2854785 RepID=UPI001C475FFC|nr:TlpA disulfide reductase family protein [Chitinophaga sp. sic0106]MBV7532085.1 AhpC/TSA family protein [Chitinophaga sp. sic0106]